MTRLFGARFHMTGLFVLGFIALTLQLFSPSTASAVTPKKKQTQLKKAVKDSTNLSERSVETAKIISAPSAFPSTVCASMKSRYLNALAQQN